MVRYWCTYNNNDGSKITAGYRSLVGLITDIVENLHDKDCDTYSYTLRENHEEEFTIVLDKNKFNKQDQLIILLFYYIMML